MFVPSDNDLLPGFDYSRIYENADAPLGACPSESELDEKFRQMREESSRTMALMRSLRASPLYRYASVDSLYDGE